MPFTGKLGTADSRLGNIVLAFLGAPPDPSLEQEVNQSLSFSQSATFEPVNPHGDDTLAFSQSATAVVHRHMTASNALALMQATTVSRSVSRTVNDTLVFVQDVGNNIKQVNVTQSLAFVQDAVARGAIRVSVGQSLNFVQNDDGGHVGVANLFVAQALVLSDRAGLTFTRSVTQTLAFTQTGERRNAIVDVLALVQTATVGKGGDVDQTLALVQSTTGQLVLRRTLADVLGLNQSVTYYIGGRGCTEKLYSPFVGSSTDPSYTPPSLTVPTLTKGVLTLTYPYVSPTTTLVLRNPELGDKDRLNFNRINRLTRGGTLIVFADPKWPKTQTLVVQVDSLKPAQAADLIQFLRDSLGQEIGLLDWESRQWRGIITTPDAQITHVGRGDRSVAFEFQGVLA